MRKIILTVLGASLIAASAAQMAAAAERHHVRHLDRAAASRQFRNSNNALVSPAQPGSGYFEGRGMSAPAGR